MIKLINDEFCDNIGDKWASNTLKNDIEIYTGKEAEHFNYLKLSKVYNKNISDEDIEKNLDKLVTDCEMVIYGPGGLLIDYADGPVLPDIVIDKLVELSIPIVVCSAGFNRYYNVEIGDTQRALVSKLLNSAVLCGVRTWGDVKIANTYRNGIVNLCPDPLLIRNNSDRYYKKDYVCISMSKHLKNIGISIIDTLRGHGFTADLVDHESNNGAILDLYRACEYVVTSRFHGGILARISNKNCFFVTDKPTVLFVNEIIYGDKLRDDNVLLYQYDKDVFVTTFINKFLRFRDMDVVEDRQFYSKDIYNHAYFDFMKRVSNIVNK